MNKKFKRPDSVTILIDHKWIVESTFYLTKDTKEFESLKNELTTNIDQQEYFDIDLNLVALPSNFEISILNDALIEDLKEVDSWNELGFDVILGFTKIVVNKEMDMAIVDFAESEGRYMSYGITYFFRKIGVTWTIIDELGIDIS